MGRRPDGNRYNKRDLTRNESFRQIFTTLGWTPPSRAACFRCRVVHVDVILTRAQARLLGRRWEQLPDHRERQPRGCRERPAEQKESKHSEDGR
jgi:hypothetical protein